MYIDFSKLATEIHFIDLLDRLEIPYKKKGDNIITDEAVISNKKNLFFWKGKDKGGNVIQFLVDKMNLTHREAGIWLQKNFLTETPKRGIPELELHYCDEMKELGITPELAKDFEVGLVKQRSVMAGHIAFKCYDEKGESKGYVGLKKGNWLFPKSFKRDFLYNLNRRVNNTSIIVLPNILDVIHLKGIGISYCCAAVGQSLTDRQTELLKQFKRILLFGFNNDSVCNQLHRSSFVKFVPDGKLIEIKSFF